MSDDTHFATRGLGKLIADLHRTFPGSMDVDYIKVCGLKKSKIRDEADAEQVRALGNALVLLQKDGFLLGKVYENDEFRYFWGCQLTVSGFNVCDGLLREALEPLGASEIMSAFQRFSNSVTR